MAEAKEISVFVDESGSFVPFGSDPHSPYYLICLVIHNQSVDISSEIEHLNDSFRGMGLAADLVVHAGPLVRREDEYAQMPRQLRIGIFRRMMAFIQKANFGYRCFKVFKPYNSRQDAIHDGLLQDLLEFLIAHRDLFNGCKSIRVYYDNGQAQVKSLLLEAFAVFSSKTFFVENVVPGRYRLFQAADVICTLELIKAKLARGESLTLSEARFFGGERNLRKNYLKPIGRKELA